MADRRSDDDLGWDFSFVGDEGGSRAVGSDAGVDPGAPRRAAPNGGADDAWDFSFVGERARRGATGPSGAGDAVAEGAAARVDDVSWDFSFVGGRVRDGLGENREHAGPAAEGAAAAGAAGVVAGRSVALEPVADPAWDFSFVGDDSTRSADDAADAFEALGRLGDDFDPPSVPPIADGEGDAGEDWPSPAEGDLVDHAVTGRTPDPVDEAAGGGADGSMVGPVDEAAGGGADGSMVSSVDGAAGAVADGRAVGPAESIAAAVPGLEGASEDEIGIESVEGPTPGAAASVAVGLDADDVDEWPPPAGSPSGEFERPPVDPTDLMSRPSMAEPRLDGDGDDVIDLDPTPVDPTPIAMRDGSDGPVKVLTICTHNRTRSVMMMALLQAGFDRALGPGAVMVRSLGFGPEGEPPIADAVDEMADRGLDVSAHRSLQVSGPRVEPADLILTAEREHVIKVADASPETFRRTFTLPEFCRAVTADPIPGSRSIRQWMLSLSATRTSVAYLSDEIPEVDDPTGSPKRQFAAATATIEAMCDTVVDLVAPAIRHVAR